MSHRFLGLAAAALLAVSSTVALAQGTGDRSGNITPNPNPATPPTSAGTPVITGTRGDGMPNIERTGPGTGNLGGGAGPITGTGAPGMPIIQRPEGVGAPPPGGR